MVITVTRRIVQQPHLLPVMDSNAITVIVLMPTGDAMDFMTAMMLVMRSIVSCTLLPHVVDSNVKTENAFHPGSNVITVMTVVITAMNTMAVVLVCNEVL